MIKWVMMFFMLAGGLSAAEASGKPLIERILAKETPFGLIPFWHDYPWAKTPEAAQWTQFTYETLERDGKALVNSEPGDMTLFCPGYPRMDQEKRLVFWTRFISVLAELESTYDITAKTYEPQWDVHSTGMLMLSLASSQQSQFQCHMIQRQSDLTDWRKNIGCAVRIMSHYMSRDEVITWYETGARQPHWTGLARYWGPLRDARLRSPEGRLQIQKLVQAKRAAWRAEGLEQRHPAYKDANYKKQGETRFERLLRLMNAMPICHSS